MLRVLLVMGVLAGLAGCSDGSLEEFYLRKSLEISMAGLCGDNNDACVTAVEQQVGPCMRKADWRSYTANDQDPEQVRRFTEAFYGCIVDAEGKPLFEIPAADLDPDMRRDKGAISTSKSE